MLTIEDFKPYWGNAGIYTTFTEGKEYTSEQVQSIINSAVQQYRLLVPCFDLNNAKFVEKYKDLALSHIALIALYNVYKNAPAEQNESKTRIERDYEQLKQEFVKGIYANNVICSSLREKRNDFNTVFTGKSETIINNNKF